MCSPIRQKKRSRAFFSLDAAAWLSVATVSFLAFSLLLSSQAAARSSQAHAVSSALLSLRLSSYLIWAACEGKGNVGGEYCVANRLDGALLSSLDYGGLLARIGRQYLSVSVEGKEGESFAASAGAAGGETFCTSRLVEYGGKTSLLRACIS